MTEYNTSPEAIEVFRSSRDRTAHWVHSHTPLRSQFHSPDSPPSVVGDVDAHDSDGDSSHSLPPKMVLRYGDGRADIPISHWHYENVHDPHRGRPRPHTAYHAHDRARPATEAYLPPHARYHDHAVPHRRPTRHGLPRAREDDFSTPPEEIHILPSDPNAQPHRPTGTYRPRRASEPQRHQLAHPSPFDDEPEVIEPLPPRHPPNNHLEAPPPVMYSHSQHIHDPYDHQHPGHSHSRGNRPPPSIVYAPGHLHHTNDHYAPPTVVYAPHKAPGMNYTVSAPTGSGFPQYPRITATPYNPVHSNLSSVHEEPRFGPRGPIRRRENSMPRAPSPISESVSGDSGDTYYIVPTPGQKVKVLVGPEPSLFTATSTTKSASSPFAPYTHSGASSGGGGFKRPLFSRLMSFASDLRPSRRFLQRRHSLDASSRRGRSRDR